MENLIGQKFNRLEVINFSHCKNNSNMWLCLCDCGNKVIVAQAKLKSGHTKSCGCIKRIDLTGQRFGLLTVSEFYEGKNKKSYWTCICDCGNETIVRADQLKDGTTKSCGCYAKDRSLIELPDFTPDVAAAKAKSIYKHMKQRCYNEGNTRYKNYGGRGIKICDRWLESFENFYEDMGSPPSHKHQLDRKDNNGNYELENCHWVTNKQNNQNKETDFSVTYKEITRPLYQWVAELGIDFSTAKKRIVCGWSVEDAFEKNVGEF